MSDSVILLTGNEMTNVNIGLQVACDLLVKGFEITEPFVKLLLGVEGRRRCLLFGLLALHKFVEVGLAHRFIFGLRGLRWAEETIAATTIARSGE